MDATLAAARRKKAPAEAAKKQPGGGARSVTSRKIHQVKSRTKNNFLKIILHR
jgi:hypothetical protein